MEDVKEIETLLRRNQLNIGSMTEDELKFLHGGYSVSETDGDESVSFIYIIESCIWCIHSFSTTYRTFLQESS